MTAFVHECSEGWTVSQSNGEHALFSGPRAMQRAREYASGLNRKTRAQGGAATAPATPMYGSTAGQRGMADWGNITSQINADYPGAGPSGMGGGDLMNYELGIGPIGGSAGGSGGVGGGIGASKGNALLGTAIGATPSIDNTGNLSALGTPLAVKDGGIVEKALRLSRGR